MMMIFPCDSIYGCSHAKKVKTKQHHLVCVCLQRFILAIVEKDSYVNISFALLSFWYLVFQSKTQWWTDHQYFSWQLNVRNKYLGLFLWSWHLNYRMDLYSQGRKLNLFAQETAVSFLIFKAVMASFKVKQRYLCSFTLTKRTH